MSSSRKIVVPSALIEKLKQFYELVIAYDQQHKDDPDYYSKLTKPLNELRTRQTGLMKDVEYANEVADRYVKISRYKRNLEEKAENKGYQEIHAHVLNLVINDLKDEIDLFDRNAQLSSEEAEQIHRLCQSLIKELADLSEHVILFKIETVIEQLQELSMIVSEHYANNHNDFESHCADFLNAYKVKPTESKEPISIYLNSLPAIDALKKDITFFQKVTPDNTNEHSLLKMMLDDLNAISEHAASLKK